MHTDGNSIGRMLFIFLMTSFMHIAALGQSASSFAAWEIQLRVVSNDVIYVSVINMETGNPVTLNSNRVHFKSVDGTALSLG